MICKYKHKVYEYHQKYFVHILSGEIIHDQEQKCILYRQKQFVLSEDIIHGQEQKGGNKHNKGLSKFQFNRESYMYKLFAEIF